MNTIYDLLAELRPEHDFHQSTNYIEDSLLDSFDIVSLIAAIEERWGITIDALDIIPENFASVETIAAMIQKNGGSL